MTEAALPFDEIIDVSRIQERPSPAESYFSRGRLKKTAQLYARAKGNSVAVILDECRAVANSNARVNSLEEQAEPAAEGAESDDNPGAALPPDLKERLIGLGAVCARPSGLISTDGDRGLCRGGQHISL